MDIIWVQKEDAKKIWPKVEPFLVSAMMKWLPLYRSSDLLDNVQEDKMQLWIITDNKEEKLYGAGLTQIHAYPLAKLLNVFLLGGKDMKKWKNDFPAAVELFAKSQGCEYLQAIGRRGWTYIPNGFESAVVMNKALI